MFQNQPETNTYLAAIENALSEAMREDTPEEKAKKEQEKRQKEQQELERRLEEERALSQLEAARDPNDIKQIQEIISNYNISTLNSAMMDALAETRETGSSSLEPDTESIKDNLVSVMGNGSEAQKITRDLQDRVWVRRVFGTSSEVDSEDTTELETAA